MPNRKPIAIETSAESISAPLAMFGSPSSSANATEVVSKVPKNEPSRSIKTKSTRTMRDVRKRLFFSFAGASLFSGAELLDARASDEAVSVADLHPG